MVFNILVDLSRNSVSVTTVVSLITVAVSPHPSLSLGEAQRDLPEEIL